MKRAVENAQFSFDMFPGKNKRAKVQLQCRFAQDLKRRCTAEFNLAHAQLDGDTHKIIRSLSYTADAIINCYRGDCGKSCRRHSLVCGGSKLKRWQRFQLPSLNIEKDDELILRKIISMRLGRDAIIKTRRNSSTQKTEAVHRSYSSTNPKSITCSRNFPGRIHTAVHKLNSGIAKSTIERCRAVGAPLTPGSKVVQTLKQEEKRERYQAHRKKQQDYRTRRCSLRCERYNLHEQKTQSNEITYQSGMMENLQTIRLPRLPKKAKTDHNYVKS
jgi:hypothetical protein